MLSKETKEASALAEGRQEYVSVYRDLMELMGRFGYVSKEEAMYGFDLSEQDARNRLNYLVRQNLVRRFRSLAEPKFFYCLTKEGLATLRHHAPSDEAHPFDPESYRPFYQSHDRTLTKIYCAMKKLFGSDFLAWLSEKTIRQGESLKLVLEAHKERRILDGLFHINVKKEKFAPDAKGELVLKETVSKPWWCGLELEMSLKSKERYRKQFKALAECVYDRVNEIQRIPLMLFLAGTTTICQALMKYQQEQAASFGRCVFVFGAVDQFLAQRENAILTRFIGNKFLEITGGEINHVKMKVTP